MFSLIFSIKWSHRHRYLCWKQSKLGSKTRPLWKSRTPFKFSTLDAGLDCTFVAANHKYAVLSVIEHRASPCHLQTSIRFNHSSTIFRSTFLSPRSQQTLATLSKDHLPLKKKKSFETSRRKTSERKRSRINRTHSVSLSRLLNVKASYWYPRWVQPSCPTRDNTINFSLVHRMRMATNSTFIPLK